MKRILKIVLISLLAVIVLFCGAYYLLIKQSMAEKSGPFIETRCGATGGDKHPTLVAYDSKFSSTGKIAETIAMTLCEQGASVDVRLVSKVTSVDAYESVVIGSPIYYGFWLPDAKAFLKKFEDKLAKRRVAVFVVSNTVREGRDSPESRAKVKKYFIDPTIEDFPKILPVEPHGIFGGKMDSRQWSWFEAAVMGMMGLKDNDSRDPNKVKVWAGQISKSLLAGK